MVLYPEAAIANRARLNANKVFKRLSTMSAWERRHPCLPLLAKRCRQGCLRSQVSLQQWCPAF